MQTGNLGNIALKLEGQPWDSQKSYPALTALRHQSRLWGALRKTAPGEQPGYSQAWMVLAYDSDASPVVVSPGDVKFVARPVPSQGWLECSGAEVGRTAYPKLFEAIGTVFGQGDGQSTFNLPDLRGQFIRGWDCGRGLDPGRIFGSDQGFALENITGNAQIGGYSTSGTNNTGALYGLNIANYAPASAAVHNTVKSANQLAIDASRVASTAEETRPRNVALMACIKY